MGNTVGAGGLEAYDGEEPVGVRRCRSSSTGMGTWSGESRRVCLRQERAQSAPVQLKDTRGLVSLEGQM